MNSLGVFHHSPSVSLASFANRVSAGDRDPHSGQSTAALIPHPPASRKAGYGCTQRYAPEGTMHRIAGSSSASYMDPLTTMVVRPRTRTGLHGNRVGVSMPLEIALSPQARKARFLPASTQDWASQADTRSFTGVPFGGFLGPPSETADLTRILRRRLAPDSIAYLAAICNYFCIYTQQNGR